MFFGKWNLGNSKNTSPKFQNTSQHTKMLSRMPNGVPNACSSVTAGVCVCVYGGTCVRVCAYMRVCVRACVAC